MIDLHALRSIHPRVSLALGLCQSLTDRDRITQGCGTQWDGEWLSTNSPGTGVEEEHFQAVEIASVALDVAFSLVRAVQFPEVAQGRIEEAIDLLAQIEQRPSLVRSLGG